MITTLSDIKIYLGISDTSQDARLTLLQESCEAFVKWMVGEVEQSTATERVKYRYTHQSGSFLLQRKPITAISKIQGNTLTLVNDVDWIATGNRVTIPRLSEYINQYNEFDSWTIEYTAGYTALLMPKDLKLAVYLLISWEYSKDAGQGVKKVKLWEREVEYDLWANPNLLQVKTLLNKYRPLYNFVW